MKRDASPDRSGDWEFEEHKCVECRGRFLGKNMWPCAECQRFVCEACDMVQMGCADDDEARLCSYCFKEIYKGNKKYCTEKTCPDCSNKPPRFKAQQRRMEEQFYKFKKHFDIEKWKQENPPINYAGKYKGKHLIDLFLSDDSFEHGYVDWLIARGKEPPDTAYSREQNKNFQVYVSQARELKSKLEQTKLTKKTLRKRA